MQKDKQTLDEIHKLAADFYHDAGSKLFTIRNMGRTMQKVLPKLLDCYEDAVAQGKMESLGRNERLGLELAKDGLTTAAQKLTKLHKGFWISLDSMISAGSAGLQPGEDDKPPLRRDAISGPPPTCTEKAPAGQSGHRILFVEDEPTYRLVFSELLHDHDCRVELANDGLQALKLLEQQHFDLILMDVRMPNLNGFETTARIRRFEENHCRDCIPIIGISDSPLDEDRRRGIEVRMNEFITKTQAYEGIAELLQRYPVRPPG